MMLDDDQQAEIRILRFTVIKTIVALTEVGNPAE